MVPIVNADSPDRPQRADARRNRELILEAARQAFQRAGADVQMDDIAAGAGVGVGTVYRHFPTKEALLDQLIRRHFERLVSFAEDELADEGTEAWTAFERFARRSAESCAGDLGLQHAFHQAADPGAGPRLAQETGLFERTERLIARGHQAGVLRADFTPTDVGMMFCGLAAVMPGEGPGWDWRRHLELLLDGTRSR